MRAQADRRIKAKSINLTLFSLTRYACISVGLEGCIDEIVRTSMGKLNARTDRDGSDCLYRSAARGVRARNSLVGRG